LPMDTACILIPVIVAMGVAMLCCIGCWHSSTRIKRPVARRVIMTELVEFNLFVCAGFCMFACTFIFMCCRFMQLTQNRTPQIIMQTTPTNDTECEQCYICMENHADTILLNCKHGGICMSCASSITKTTKKCPLCREPVRTCILQSSIIEMQPPRSPAPAYHPSESHPPPPES
jgi:hypothetical protein